MEKDTPTPEMDGRKQRGPNIHHWVMSAILADIYSGMSDAEACERHDVKLATWKLWCKKARDGIGGYEELANQLQAYDALQTANLIQVVLDALNPKLNVTTRTTTQYDKFGKVKGSTVMVEQKPPPADLALRLLALRAPRHWADKLVLDEAQRQVIRDLIEQEVAKGGK